MGNFPVTQGARVLFRNLPVRPLDAATKAFAVTKNSPARGKFTQSLTS